MSSRFFSLKKPKKQKIPRCRCSEAYFTLALVSLEFIVKNLNLNSNQHLSKNAEYQDIFQEVIQLFKFVWARIFFSQAFPNQFSLTLSL